MNEPGPRTPFYWRLSGFYLFYFASLGALVPYWSLYLKSLSFSPREIGEIMAIIMATKIISPNIWGWIADHSGKRMRIVRLGSLAGALAFAAVLFATSYWWIAIVMVVFSFFWNAVLPQFEAYTFSQLKESVHRYSAIRLWGSVGFILTVIVLGPILEERGTSLLPWAIVALLAGIFLMSLAVPEQSTGYHHGEHDSLFKVIRRPEVFSLILVVFLMQVSHGPYYTFYSIYMEEHGYSRSIIGMLWALGVVAEVLVFFYMHRLIPRFGLRKMLLFSLMMAALRWSTVGWFVDNFAMMLAAQLLHAATFGIFHSVAIQLFHRHFTGKNQGRGQAIYSSMSFGAGGALGSLVAGYTWVSIGPAITYSGAAVISVIAFIIAWRNIHTCQ
ncbi:MAG: MFS transporter [Gammaproteobacteria bacterium]|nr:MAG: MFS transporter [Gammaproteobacteria bacterium]